MHLDPKALEAAKDWHAQHVGDSITEAEMEVLAGFTRAYLSASLPSDDEVGRLCEQLRELAKSCGVDFGTETGSIAWQAAALLQSQAAGLAAQRARAERAEAALAEKDKALEPFAEAGRAMLMTGGRNPKLSGPRLAEHLDAARRARSAMGGE